MKTMRSSSHISYGRLAIIAHNLHVAQIAYFVSFIVNLMQWKYWSQLYVQLKYTQNGQPSQTEASHKTISKVAWEEQSETLVHLACGMKTEATNKVKHWYTLSVALTKKPQSETTHKQAVVKKKKTHTHAFMRLIQTHKSKETILSHSIRRWVHLP